MNLPSSCMTFIRNFIKICQVVQKIFREWYCLQCGDFFRGCDLRTKVITCLLFSPHFECTFETFKRKLYVDTIHLLRHAFVWYTRRFGHRLYEAFRWIIMSMETKFFRSPQPPSLLFKFSGKPTMNTKPLQVPNLVQCWAHKVCTEQVPGLNPIVATYLKNEMKVIFFFNNDDQFPQEMSGWNSETSARNKVQEIGIIRNHSLTQQPIFRKRLKETSSNEKHIINTTKKMFKR